MPNEQPNTNPADSLTSQSDVKKRSGLAAKKKPGPKSQATSQPDDVLLPELSEEEQERVRQEDERIKNRIRQTITSKGLRLKQFARESGMAYPSLRDYNSGLRKPGFEAIATLLEFTGVEAAWLIQGKGEMFPPKKPLRATVDEALLGQIAGVVEKNDLLESKYFADAVHDSAESDGTYAGSTMLKERQLRAGNQGLITGTIYNRVANIEKDDLRNEAIELEAKMCIRLKEGLRHLATGID